MTTTTDLTPSPARTALLQSCLLPIQVVQMEPKTSADCLDYSLDFTNVLQCTGDTPSAINSITVQTAQQETYDLTVMWSGVSGSMATMLLASGQPGTVQRLLVEVATNQGRILSVAVLIRITDLTDATPPPSDFPADVTTNGKVLIAGNSALPTGYSSNGRVVMLSTQEAPVGTPDFESVTAGTYSGDGSGLNITADEKTQTIAEWIASLASGGAQGVGIVKIEATQGTVTAGQPSTVTLTATLTDGSTSETTFTAPAGAIGEAGGKGDPGSDGVGIKSISSSQGTITPGSSSTVTLTTTLTDGTTTAPITFDAPSGAPGEKGSSGATGVGIASIASTQGAVTTGQASTVTLTATMTDGSTAAPVTFEAPPGAQGVAGAKGDPGTAGSDATVTSDSIESALGYTPADPSKFAALEGATFTGGVTFPGSIGITIKDNTGGYIYTEWSYGNLQFVGGNGQGALQWPGTMQTASFAFASLPSSPKDWAFAIVTDKAIGSGSQGVMAMYNPNTKAWTGLSGEALV